MAFLSRDEVEAIVIKTLNLIADLPEGDIENTSLAMLNDDQKQIFLTALKSNINNYPYHLRDNSPSDDAYYDIAITIAIIDDWKTVGDCIDWITENQISVDKN